MSIFKHDINSADKHIFMLYILLSAELMMVDEAAKIRESKYDRNGKMSVKSRSMLLLRVSRPR